MKFGVLDHLDFGGRDDLAAHYAQRLALVEQLERSGFYGYHITEHHGTPLGGGAAPSVFLSAAAQRTKTLRIGTLVYSLPTHHPLRLIEEICMLDQLSDGRLDIGFGRGSVPSELTYYGIDPDEARAIHSEAFNLVRMGLTTGKLDHQGKYFSFDNLPMALKPKQKPMPPVWYGVHSIEAAQLSAKEGFHIVCNQEVGNSAHFISCFREAVAARGENPDDRMIGLHRAVVVAPTDAAAMEIAERAYQSFLVSFRFVSARHGVETKISGRENSFAELMEVGRGIAGSPQTVAAFLKDQLKTAQANYCLMYVALGDMSGDEVTQSVDLFTREVMPRLQG
jgi:alkanesulfonate monooxygenase SsuD/methylene tetrahydromethanopterin reductase-like flavin-dependent oxidoreductase (luciferase family)